MQIENNHKARLNRYGINAKVFDEIMARQDNRCAICKSPPGKRSLAIDHDHFTNKVRGLLCTSCNVALGLMKDNVLYLTSAINYLSSNPKRIPFYVWLEGQKNRKDPVGDLARDMIDDGTLPKRKDLKSLRSHMYWHGACSEALDALKEAWKEYKSVIPTKHVAK